MRYLGARAQAGESGINFQWWTSDDPGSDMVKVARKIAEKQTYIREQMLWHARLHGGTEIAGLTPTAYARPAVAVMVGETVGLNVIESCVSTAQAEICQNKPKATFTTDGGDWDIKQKAEKLDKFCEGQFYAVDLYKIAPDVFGDACIFGTGILKIYEDESKNQITVERVFPWELLVDQADGVYGSPMCLYQTKYVDRSILMRAYPDKAAQIKDVQSDPLGIGRDPFMYDTTADLVQVIEAWRLPTGPAANDNKQSEGETAEGQNDPKNGRHIVAVADVTLLDEPWEEPDFPFAFLRWLKRPFGFWGKGLTEQLAGVQKEINRLLIKIQRAFARLGITRVFIQRGSKVNPSHMRSNDGDIIEYTGQRPETVAETPVSPQIFEHLWRLEQKAYEITGISQMTAQGQAPPPGVDSGRAIRTMLQNHSKRFVMVGQAYEEFFLTVGKKMIALARQISRRQESEDGRKGYQVRWATEAGSETIDFAEIDLDEDEYVMRPYPTSALPSNPAEKMQTVQEWFNTGMIDGTKAMMLMDFPDTKSFVDMDPTIASQKAVMRKLTAISKEGKPWTPDSFVDRQSALPIAVAFLLNAEEDGVPEERLDLIRQCIEDLQAPPPQPGGPQPPGPEGGQAAPPGAGPDQLPQPGPGALPPQVAPIGPMQNPMQPQAA